MAGLALSVLLSALGTSIANVALPTLAQVFDASFSAVQWVVLAYLLAITTLVISAGRLGDMAGRRRLLIIGIILFIASSLAAGAAPSLWVLIAARAVQGLGAAIMMALAMALMSDTAPAGKTGSAMGLLGTMSAIGTALGPALGGYLIAGLGWQTIFLINVPLGLLALLLVWRALPADAPKGAALRFDTTGTLLLVITLASYALAMTAGRGSFGWLSVVLLVAAAVGGALFIRSQSRTVSPLINTSLLQMPGLTAALGMSALVATVMMTTMIVGPFYLSGPLGLDARSTGFVMAIGPAVAALAGVPSGRLTDYFGAARMTMGGLAGIAAGTGLLALMPVSTGLPGYVLPLIIITGGYAAFQTANNAAVLKDVAADQRGVVSGLLNLSRNLGLITGAAAMGAVFAFASASTTVTTAASEALGIGMRITFAAAFMLTMIALLIAIANAIARRPGTVRETT
jgi:EmrB/QacA subfamily drug resistance transporter